MADRPHDALIKATFSQLDNAQAYLQNTLSKELSEALYWPSLEMVAGSYVDESLRATQSDLLYRIEWRESESETPVSSALIYILFEHQSSNDPKMAFRLLRYLVRIWEQHGELLPLPAIFPLVLYHGEAKWTAKRDFLDLFALNAAQAQSFGEFLPSFRYFLDDLNERSDEELIHIHGPTMVKLVTLMLKYGRSPGFEKQLEQWRTLFASLIDKLSAREGLRNFSFLIHYVVSVNEQVDSQVLGRLAQYTQIPQAEDVLMTLAEQWKQEGLEKGLEKGLERGLEKGREDSLQRSRTMTLKLLTLKFAEVGAAYQAQVQSASQSELDEWHVQLLSAQSLDEVFQK